jgi:hypothetical protein
LDDITAEVEAIRQARYDARRNWYQYLD